MSIERLYRIMKKNKDFTYYGKKRLQVKRLLKDLDGFKFHILYILIPFVLIGLVVDIETNFSFTFTTTGGILATIFFAFLLYYFFLLCMFIVLSILDKYYFKKRQELLEQYIQEKGVKHTVTGK